MTLPVVGLSGVAGATATVPSAPTGVSAVANANSSATVTWTVGANGGDPITYFVITPYIGGTAQSPVPIAAQSPYSPLAPTPGAVDNIPFAENPGPTYTFTVASESALGIGPASSPTNEVVMVGYPATPTDISAVATSTQITLYWTVAANNGYPITGFTIIYEFTSPDGTGATQFFLGAGPPGSALDPTPGARDSAVMPSTYALQYGYEIQALNVEGDSDPSDETQGWVYAQLVNPSEPGAPTGVSATSNGNGSVTVTWTVGSDGGTPIGYFVLTPYVGTTAQSPTTVVAGAGVPTSDPTPGATDSFTLSIQTQLSETFTVQSANAIGLGPASNPSNEVSATASTVPPTPTPTPTTPTPSVPTSPTTPATPTIAIGGASPSSISFDDLLVGDVSNDASIDVENNGDEPAEVTYGLGGADPDDFVVDTSGCQDIAALSTCTLDAKFVPGAIGLRSATLTIQGGSAPPLSMTLSGTGIEGYYVATSTGVVHGYGEPTPPFYGDASTTHLSAPVVSMQTTGDDGGYWLATSDGGVFAFGDAQFYGSAGAMHLNRPIVGMAVTPDDGGYWLVASDGGIFAFGDARFYGSTGALHLNRPIVGMAATPDGGGYWLVASDGGIFAFGDAQFYGSTGGIHLNQPIVGMAASPDGGGYWLTASDGGVFAFGDAPFDGSAGGLGITNAIGVAGTAPPTLQAFLGVPALRGRTEHHLPRPGA